MSYASGGEIELAPSLWNLVNLHLKASIFPLLGVYFTNPLICKYIIGDILIAALFFSQLKTTNNPKIHHQGSINILWNIHKMKCYMAIQKIHDLYVLI